MTSGTPGTNQSYEDGGTNLRLLELRAAAGLSRERLAALAGLSPRTVFGIERQGVRPQQLTRLALAAALHCDPDDLLPPESGGEL